MGAVIAALVAAVAQRLKKEGLPAMQFRLTLVQNLPNRAPSALSVTYTYRDGHMTTWPVQAVGPDRDTAVVVVECVGHLIHQQDVSTRELTSHYPTAPHTVVTGISSVQPA